ncbi:MAG: hypothetical protein Q4F77_02565, partial [Acinetobacter sp.]|uniref:hypothetical protein n=1 Tax=Acinetobacter sp. TaxID=472 RepID=UPI0026DF7BF7
GLALRVFIKPLPIIVGLDYGSCPNKKESEFYLRMGRTTMEKSHFKRYILSSLVINAKSAIATISRQ